MWVGLADIQEFQCKRRVIRQGYTEKFRYLKTLDSNAEFDGTPDLVELECAAHR